MISCLLSSIESRSRLREPFSSILCCQAPLICVLQLVLLTPLERLLFCFEDQNSWLSWLCTSVILPKWLTSRVGPEPGYQNGEEAEATAISTTNQLLLDFNDWACRRVKEKRETNRSYYIPVRGRSRGRGLLLFIPGCATSPLVGATKGSISHGETLSGLTMDAGSSQ